MKGAADIGAGPLAMRERAKRLMGASYGRHMADLGGILRMTAARDGTTPLAVAQSVCTTRSLAGLDALLIIAAAVELEDPSA